MSWCILRITTNVQGSFEVVPGGNLPVVEFLGHSSSRFHKQIVSFRGGNVLLRSISRAKCSELDEFGINQGAYSINTTHDVVRVTEPSGVLT
jgi:hypothetical protein